MKDKEASSGGKSNHRPFKSRLPRFFFSKPVVRDDSNKSQSKSEAVGSTSAKDKTAGFPASKIPISKAKKGAEGSTDRTKSATQRKSPVKRLTESPWSQEPYKHSHQVTVQNISQVKQYCNQRWPIVKIASNRKS